MARIKKRRTTIIQKEPTKTEPDNPVEITVYTFFQPPDGGSIMRADMPIDILYIEREKFEET